MHPLFIFHPLLMLSYHLFSFKFPAAIHPITVLAMVIVTQVALKGIFVAKKTLLKYSFVERNVSPPSIRLP